jgi:membrane-bound lytic murein transglycosylase B
MTAQRFGKAQKVATLVPLALLSAAWTASLAGVGAGTVNAAADQTQTLPDGTPLPTEAVEDPANYSDPTTLGLGITSGKTDQIVQTSSTNGIPSAALAAYQRAATVINAADRGCGIPWQLIAAIGRVESDHGRYGGNTLGQDGLSRPGIFGIALDGSNNTQKIPDSDAGQYDSDAKFDRAVGPMQFIPSTWSVVGVDADGDSQRNPQDIDDASLATAVYLCSGDDDLGTDAGRRASVYRYNHSKEYVDLVLRIMQAYMDGDFTSVPNNTTSAVTFTPDYNYTRPTLVPKGNGSKGGGGTGGGGSSSGGGGSTPAGGGTTTTPPADTPAAGGGTGVPDAPDVPDTPDVPDPVPNVLSLNEAKDKCRAALNDATPLTVPESMVNNCANQIVGKTAAQANAALPGIVANLIGTLGLG